MTKVNDFPEAAENGDGENSALAVSGIARRAALSAAAGFAAALGGSVLAPARLDSRKSVSDRGATGDGVTDDTANIQALIDEMHARGGGVVSLPRGDFRIAGTLRGKRGVSIVGQGSLASRLLKTGAGDCLVYGTGTSTRDADLERVALEGFAIIGNPRCGHLFWGRKATTAFALRDLYFESGNSPVFLDSCYSLVMENVQVRGAETGDNISVNAVSHNVLLLQVSSQVAKAGAGISIGGCNAPVILGGKLEYNQRDQLRIDNACRGVSIVGLYIEGIQPTASGYAGITVYDVDTVTIQGGFFDATQGDAKGYPGGGPMGTNGTGTYVRTRGRTSRLTCSGYGFASIARTQRHVEIGAAADACEVTLPLGASFVNAAPMRNVVRFGPGEDGPISAAQDAPQQVRHGADTPLAFEAQIDDMRGEWNKRDGFTPIRGGYYGWSGFVRLSGVPAGSKIAVTLYDATENVQIARLDRSLGPGSQSVDFSFRERLSAGRTYQIRLSYFDGEARTRATSGGAPFNRMLIERTS